MNYLERLELGYTSEEAKYMDRLERSQLRDELERKDNLTDDERELLFNIYDQEEKEGQLGLAY